MAVTEIARRSFLTGACTLLTTAVIGAAPRPAQTTFYVSAVGNDNADGLTAATAWATIQKVNKALPSGSSVLFRRGDSFFGELNPPPYCDIGSYGAGPMPILTMYKLLNRPEGWVAHSAGVWRINLADPSTHDGYTATSDANIGHLVVDGVVKASKRQVFQELKSYWDFWCEPSTKTLFVIAPDNPAKLAADIRAAPRGEVGSIVRCDQGSANIHDIHVTGTGGHGVTGVAADVHIWGCLIDYIGGSFLMGYKDDMVRYGNAIENWVGAKRWLIENNEIAQTYDVAYTCQGIAGGSDQGWEDMVFRSNYVHDCTQSFEFWSTGPNTSAGFQRILVENNHCQRAGYSDFADFRPNQSARVHLQTFNWDLPADITVQNNTFDGAYSAYSYHLVEPTGLVSRHNTIRLSAGTKMQYQRPETVEQAAAWQAATGREKDSSITARS